MMLNKLVTCFCFFFVPFTAISAFAEKVNDSHIHTRTLAASCAACHGTNGNSHSITPVLAGLDASYFSTQMQAFKHDGRSSTVMHHHAKGLSDDEIEQLANYFSKQKRIAQPPLKPEKLKAKP